MTAKIYTTQQCSYCRQAKDYLEAKNVPYETIDVGADLNARKEMFEKAGRMSVPVIDIGGKIVVGFDKKAIDLALT